MTLAELIEAARNLPPADRVKLVDEVMATIDESDLDEAGVNAAWTAEIGGRIDDVLSGTVTTIPFREIDARLRAKIAATR